MRAFIKIVLAACVVFAAAPVASAQDISATGSTGSVGNGLLISGHAFFYSDSSSLGGAVLNDGSSSFLRGDVQYNWQEYFVGVGGFYERDSFGEGQTDSAFGAIIEIVFGSFFIKMMPGFMEQNFVERSFAKRSGSFLGFEGGVRGSLYDKLVFYEVALHRRTQSITQEDSRDMADPFSKTEMMPMLGVGISL